MPIADTGRSFDGRYKDVSYTATARWSPSGGYRARYKLKGEEPVAWFDIRFETPDEGLDEAERRVREAIDLRSGQ